MCLCFVELHRIETQRYFINNTLSIQIIRIYFAGYFAGKSRGISINNYPQQHSQPILYGVEPPLLID